MLTSSLTATGPKLVVITVKLKGLKAVSAVTRQYTKAMGPVTLNGTQATGVLIQTKSNSWAV